MGGTADTGFQVSKFNVEYTDALIQQWENLHLQSDIDPLLGSDCACGEGKRIIQCRDCLSSYGSVCSKCFDESIALNFGHGGDPCPLAFSTVRFTLVDCNGIHATWAQFCSCLDVPDRVEQLLLARMCLATVDRPATAFRFNVLDRFLYTHLEGKLSAYDFVGMLQVLTDYSFPERVLVQFLAHRRKPAITINSRHLVQKQRTMDGNFHLNMLVKNSDPHDQSLFKGNAFFADKIPYQHFVSKLKAISDADIEKRECRQMKANNNQDKKKWKYMAVTGQGNCACGHSFIEASAEFQKGERQGNMDDALLRSMAMYRASDQHNSYALDIDEVLSYDIACSYSINAVKRFNYYKKQGFSQYHPHIIECLSRMRWGIPMLYIQNHNEVCRITKNMAYKDQVGHFYGEQAEPPWYEFNQVAPQARQMSYGNRQETIILVQDWWNRNKTLGIGMYCYCSEEHRLGSSRTYAS
ncbi:hypothetical protein EDD18DRAFT_1074623 [Armillaria luteobubalina]|uniref:CxC2-like cysteine cluster KDZ transposase-associated domain-containing protein n=1 Tax=Armillaria luteobubalina TaxID=153913 RepID=A0AA39UT24_9AGAR|nr:hypothetical protein EDD18DRAFT_1074623 [Armillaria luteobubalina]